MHIYYEGGQEMIVHSWFKNKPKKEVFLHTMYSFENPFHTTP